MYRREDFNLMCEIVCRLLIMLNKNSLRLLKEARPKKYYQEHYVICGALRLLLRTRTDISLRPIGW